MAIANATLAGHRATSARVQIPSWGCWWVDVSVDGEHEITGTVEFKLADLTGRGTILSGGPDKGRSFFRMVGGAGGWGKTIKAKSYQNDAGVKLATVLGDAAAEVGETLSGVSTSDRVGPSFVRPEGPASRVLELVAPGAWYVGEDGLTRLGKRAAAKFTAPATVIGAVDKARGMVTVAAESIATLVPGAIVEGITAVDVQHDISKDGLRSTVWGGVSRAASPRLAAFRALLAQLDPDREFRGVTEYRVVTQEGERVNLQPVRVSTGMPDLRRVPVRPGVAGAKSTLTPGCRVLVSFVDSDPGRPCVLGVEDADGEGFKPILTEIDVTTFLKLGAGIKPVIAAGDLAGIFPCIPTQVKVLV